MVMIFKNGLERLGDEVVVEMNLNKVNLTQIKKTDFLTSSLPFSQFFCSAGSIRSGAAAEIIVFLF